MTFTNLGMPALRLLLGLAAFVDPSTKIQSNSSGRPQQITMTAAVVRPQLEVTYAAWAKARLALDREEVDRSLTQDFYAMLGGKRVARKEFMDMILVATPGANMVRYAPAILTIERNGDDWAAVITEKLEYERVTPDGKRQRACSLWITRDGWRRVGDRWVSTTTAEISNQQWGWDVVPPFSDWAK